MSTTALTLSSSRCEPRWATERTLSRHSFGPAVGVVAHELGQPLMPWQQQVANVGLEVLDDGRPAYREVIATVPRQSGKSNLILVWMIQRALGWPSPQRIVYSAQTGNDARKKLVEDWILLLEPRKQRLGIRTILRGMGNEAVPFRNGSRIVLLASSADSGHGKTVDLAVKDEYFADVDDRRDQALVPAMATRSAAQTLTMSTMGTDESLPLNRSVDRGRLAVEDGLRSDIAYFEWSAEPGADLDDREVWWSCMPALGHTITEDVVAHARRTLTDGEFRRAFLNVRMSQSETVFPVGVWSAVCANDVMPSGALVFGVDVNPERSRAAIVAADRDGHAELVDYRAGTAWIAERVGELQARKAQVAVDASGPAKSLVPELEQAGITVTKVTDMPAACAAFYDRVLNERVRVRRHPDFDAAVSGARRKVSGDVWRWDRRDASADISPLVAATVASWVAGLVEQNSEPWMAYG